MKKTVYKALFQCLLSLFILMYILSFADFKEIIDVLSSANPTFITISILFFILASSSIGIALYFPLKDKIQVIDAILVSFGGQIISDVTPARSGYLFTSFLLKEFYLIPIDEGLKSVILTGIFNFIIKGLISLFTVFLFLNNYLPLEINVLVIVSPLLLLLLGVFLLLFSKNIDSIPFVKKISLIVRIQRRISEINLYTATLISLSIFLSIIFNSIAMHCIALSLNIKVSYLLILALVPLSTALTYIPLTIAGVGLQEGVYTYIFVLMGVDLNRAIVFSFLYRILFTGTDIIGLPILIKYYLKVGDRI